VEVRLPFIGPEEGLQGSRIDRVMAEVMNVLQCHQFYVGSKRGWRFQEGNKWS
jgi:hypothetical protein